MHSTTTEETNKHNVPFLKSFFRSQASSFVSSSTDFIIYGILFYLFSCHYLFSSIVGNICGAIVSFTLGRKWAFKSEEGKITNQALKYILTSSMSAAINGALLYLVVENTALHPTWSKVIISLLVGIFFNFPMFRYFVFKK